MIRAHGCRILTVLPVLSMLAGITACSDDGPTAPETRPEDPLRALLFDELRSPSPGTDEGTLRVFRALESVFEAAEGGS